MNESITQSILMFLIGEFESGSVPKCLDESGLSTKLKASVCRLTPREVIQFSQRMKTDFIQIKIDPEKLEIMLKDLEANKIFDDLLFAGAPNELIVQLLPVSPKCCANRRKALEINAYNCNRVARNETEARSIIGAWQSLRENVDGELQPKHWLDLYRDISTTINDINLKIIWQTVHVFLLEESQFKRNYESLQEKKNASKNKQYI